MEILFTDPGPTDSAPAELAAFAETVARALTAWRGSVLVYRQDGTAGPVDLQLREVRRIRDVAGSLGLHSVGLVLDALEDEFIKFPSETSSPSALDAASLRLLDLISHAEAEIVKISVSGKDDGFDAGDFVDRSFGLLQLRDPARSTPIPDAARPEPHDSDEFEVDVELLEIFSEEAEELLSGIEAGLNVLRATPDDRESLWEIRRHAHTFKGAAGIIGLKAPSELAHRIEDLLDHLAQNDVPHTAPDVEQIAAAAEVLRAITKGDASPETKQRMAEIYLAFDVTLGRSEKPADSLQDLGRAQSSSQMSGTLSREHSQTEPPAATAGAAAAAASATPAARRPIVRVSLNRLDELMRSVRDLVASHAALEQRASELDILLEGLARTTKQLQSAAGRIETDFESSMLDTQLPVSFGRYRNSFRENSTRSATNENFDTLELDRYTNFHESSRGLSEATQECFTVSTSMEALRDRIDTLLEEQRRLINETHEKVLRIRLIRFDSLETRLQRAVRVTCEEEGKEADIVILNPEVELDTDVLDSLVEPLMHMIRNAVAHGIEPPEVRRLIGKPEAGSITVSIANEETHVELRVSDDGRGISAAALKERAENAGLLNTPAAGSTTEGDLFNLMFLPGLSTADKLSMSAGRGVGMNIVKECVESRNGTLSFETAIQQGTTFTIRLPLAFAVTQAVLVRGGGGIFAVPVKAVSRVLELAASEIRESETGPFAVVGSEQIPIRRIGVENRANPEGALESDPADALLIDTEGARFVLVVDELIRTEEIAVRPLHKPLDSISGVLGVAVLGDGTVAPLLDMLHYRKAQPVKTAVKPLPKTEQEKIILIVDDSPSVRAMTSRVVSAAGWKVLTAKDGLDAIETLKSTPSVRLVLTDVEMPRMDGYEFVAELRRQANFSSLPVVFVTSRVGEKHREAASRLGVNEYLSKPFIESELIGTIKRLAADPKK